MDASSRKSETFYVYKVVRYKNQGKEQIILHPFEIISDLAGHQKHQINCYFTIGKTFSHNTISHNLVYYVRIPVVSEFQA